MRLLTLLLVIKVAAGQLSLGNDVELVPAMANMAQITSLDVQCEKSGMTVNVEFSQPFDGVIFSKGHFSNPACRYLDANSGRSSYTLFIPSEGCGSVMSQVGSVSPDKKKSVSQTRIVNTIIVQNDPTIQEIWDVARTIKCDWVDNFVKSVAFSPFSVGMLDAQEVAFQGDNPIECWMDLKQGKYPDIRDVDSVVKIGEPLSLMVYARDNAGMYDVSVKDCYAYGGPDYDNPNVPQIQLTDSQGCVLKDKLISSFYTSRERDIKGEVIVTYAYVKAFKFPDVMDVFMSCNIEVCKGDCDNQCGSPTTEGPFKSGSTLFGEPITTLSPSTTPLCYPGSNDPRCQRPTSPRPTTPGSPICELGSNDPNCQINFPQQAPSTFICGFGSKDPRCAPTTSAPKVGKELHTQPAPPQIFGSSRLPTSFTSPAPSSITPFICTPGSSDPRCPQPTTPAPPICFVGSTDPRCPQLTTPSPIQCFPGSTDPQCPQITSTPFTCTPGSNDPRCPQPTTPSPPKCFFGSTDPRCPKLTTTTAAPSCFPGSTDPRCPKPTTPSPPRCFPGSSDPRCPKPTTPAPPNCFPGSNDPRCPKPTIPTPPRCFPGSTDPQCPKPTTTPSPPNCFPGSTDPRCPKPTTTPEPPRCFPGSTDPRCPKPSTTTSRPRCFPGSSDPRCPKPTTPSPPSCFPGSTDPRCPKPTTLAPTTLAPPRCFPGSSDPRCPQPTTASPTTLICSFGSKDPRCRQPTTPAPPNCFPGSKDPRCPKPTTFRPITSPRPVCFAGSKDPRCGQEFSAAKSIPTKISTPAPTFKPTPGPTPTRTPPQFSTLRPVQKQSPKLTTPAPPQVTFKPKPVPTTSPPIREGFALFPVTQTTPRPTTQQSFTSRAQTPVITTSRPKPTIPSPSLKPKPSPSPKPNRGKQLGSGAPQPKPEPSGKEWEGESRYHAFHNYHFQRGDGRRGRIFGARITRDADLSKDSLSMKILTDKRPLEAKVPIRLSRSLSVIAPSDIPVSENAAKQDIGVPKAEAQTSIDPIYKDPLGTVCFPMAIFTASMLGFLFLLLLSSTAALVLYIRQSKPCKGEHTWHEH
ncbi:adhesive plaque matrix protein-like isoform X1 [Macrobrachium rosenbergii]|uniref:adhesive plaque matrix protein-like isoform X1 n=1 Tax=Macrobrachium rosenbergii TaxID=79674 RepID=UPI0034D4FA38